MTKAERSAFIRAMKKVSALVASMLVATSATAGGINHFEAAAGPHNYVVTNHPAVLPNLVPSAWMLEPRLVQP